MDEGSVEFHNTRYTIDFLPTAKPHHSLRHMKIENLNVKTPKAQIAMLHGLHESLNIYWEFATMLAERGYIIHLIDFMGWGGSGGTFFEVTAQENQSDILHLLEHMDPELPAFIYAHSMGTMITTPLLMNNPTLNISGYVMSAPAMEMLPARTPGMKFLALYMLPAMGNFVMQSGISFDTVTVRRRVLNKFFTDRYNWQAIGPKQGHMLAWLLYSFKYNTKYLKHPILMLRGGRDKVVDNEAAKKQFEEYECDKTQIEYDYAMHELHEDAKQDVLDDVDKWIDGRL